MENELTDNPLLRAVLKVRDARRLFYNLKAECDRHRQRGERPTQYAYTLKRMNDAKAQFYGAVQAAIVEGDKQLEEERKVAEYLASLGNDGIDIEKFIPTEEEYDAAEREADMDDCHECDGSGRDEWGQQCGVCDGRGRL